MYPSNVMKNHHSYNQSATSHQSTMLLKRQQQQEQLQQQQDDVHSVPRSVSTDDDDEDEEKENVNMKQGKTPAKNPVATDKSTNNSMTVVENYLRRYEHMVQQQEMEEQAVMAHILPCIHRLMELINDDSANGSTNLEKQQQHPLQLHHEISYQQLYKAYQQLILMKTKSSSTTTTITAMECMTTDRQLMMILRTMTEKMDINVTKNIMEEETSLLSISWAEFIHCYKVCIYSMMTLQHLPKGSMARLRARDRSLSIMALFEPSTTASSLVGFTDLYMLSPTHHTFNHPNAILPTTGKLNSNDEELIAGSTAAAVIDTIPSLPVQTNSQRRRPWLKKRTKRILPYLVFLVLLLAFAFWYFIFVMREERKLKNDTEANNVYQSGSDYHNYPHGLIVPTLPSKVVVTKHKNPSALLVRDVAMKHESIPNGNYHHASTFTANSKMPQNHHRSDVTIQKIHKTKTNPAAINNNDTFTPGDDEKMTPIRYHPLLGIWSNFK